MFTRLGYFVIIAILAIAGAAIAVVVVSGGSFGGGNATTPPAVSATAAATAPATAGGVPTIPFSRVIDFTRFGSVLSIDAQGADVTVTFREDFDTSGFNTNSHIFRSSLEPGQNAIDVLQAAGIRVNGSDGVTVTQR